MSEKLNAEDKIIQARVQLISKYPFWGSLVLHLTFKKDEKNEICPTMGVTPFGTVYYNERFIDSLNKEEVEGLLCHEVMHVAMKHLERLGPRNRHKANVAMDYAVNQIISKEFKLPKGGCLNSKYDGLSFEQIYDMLPEAKSCDGNCNKCPIQQGKQQLSDYGDIACKRYGSIDRHITKDEIENAQGKHKGKSGTDGEPMSAEELSEAGLNQDIQNEKEENAPNWRKILNDAVQVAKNQGKLPAGMERLIEDLTDPKLSWRELLAQFITRSIPYNFTYRKMSRKSISTGIFFPGVDKEEIKVTIVLDTSSSMGDEELRDCLSEVDGLLKQFDRVEVEFYSCDAYLSKATKIASEVDLACTRLQGGGGTSYRPIFKKIRDNIWDTKVLIYMGDMYAEFPHEEEIPSWLTVIWIVTKSGDENQIPKYCNQYVVKLA